MTETERINKQAKAEPLTFERLRSVNVSRCERWHPKGINSWSLSDWAVAMVGEAGEACDVIKKLNRCRDGLAGNKVSEDDLRSELPNEIADTLLYVDLLAAAAGIDLADAVARKFDEVSERNGFPERLTSHLVGVCQWKFDHELYPGMNRYRTSCGADYANSRLPVGERCSCGGIVQEGDGDEQ